MLSGAVYTKAWSTPNDVQLLATQVPGILAFYDARYGITLSVGKVSQWNDARGASGYGPTLTGNGTPLPSINAVPTRVTTDGANNGLFTSAFFNAGNAYSVVYVGTLPSGYGPSPALAIYDSVANTYNGFKDDGTISAADITLGTAMSATPRLALLSHSVPSSYGTDEPVIAETAAWVQGRIGTQNKIMGGRNEASRLSKLYVGGLNPDFARFSAVDAQAVMVLDHQVTYTEWAAIKAWATTYHSWTSDDTVTRSILFDGNSLTFGRFASAGNDYPSRVMAQTGFTSNLDWTNLGITGRNGGVQLSSFARRVGPFFSGNHTKKIYVCFEIGNDITQHSLTGAQAAQNVIDMCVMAKAAGATSCVAVTAPPRSDISGANETARLAANTILRGLPTGIDAVADAASNVNLQTTSNTTYFNADGIHYQDAGYLEVAANATYGVAAAVTPYL